MPVISDRGSPSSRVWVIAQTPFKNDVDKGFLFSSPMGYVFDKMMREAGFTDYYTVSAQPDLANKASCRDVHGMLMRHQPPIIIPLEAAGLGFLPQLTPKRQGKDYDPEEDSEISKYCGSLLSSPTLSYSHYMVPTYAADTVVRQWKERDIIINCDLGKAKAELDYWRQHGILQPLPQRKCQIDFQDFDELLTILRSMGTEQIISNDIETIYPRDRSVWKGLLPGYPVTIGLASSKSFGISFNLFRDSLVETRELWRALNLLFKETVQLGQNFFNFDLNFYKMLGFEIDEDRVVDTMVRNHILYPELPKKLQFMTRMYTREPYYKDEGHGWSVKDMRGLKHYNCLDVTVTHEIYQKQEEAFDERPYLR